MIGIYKIKIADYFYFGSSKNIKNRIKQHSYQLKKSCHGNSFMQNVFDKYGIFEWEVVELCALDIRIERENSYIKEHNDNKFCMNIGCRKDFDANESYLIQLEKHYKDVPSILIAIKDFDYKEESLEKLNNLIIRYAK